VVDAVDSEQRGVGTADEPGQRGRIFFNAAIMGQQQAASFRTQRFQLIRQSEAASDIQLRQAMQVMFSGAGSTVAGIVDLEPRFQSRQFALKLIVAAPYVAPLRIFGDPEVVIRFQSRGAPSVMRKRFHGHSRPLKPNLQADKYKGARVSRELHRETR
jgi:hypothetical protein